MLLLPCCWAKDGSGKREASMVGWEEEDVEEEEGEEGNPMTTRDWV